MHQNDTLYKKGVIMPNSKFLPRSVVSPSVVKISSFEQETMKSDLIRKNQFLFQSISMQQLMNMAIKVAAFDVPTLISGENGTGKGLLARVIHQLSAKAKQPFVEVNCGVLKESFVESELFGHEKGSFAGAIESKKGLVELANNGTLLLDEVSDLSLGMQAKLLRFLQTGEIYRIGSSRPINVNVRLLTTSNKELELLVAKKEFREDFFYRVNTVLLKVPPLRHRKEELNNLVEYFISSKTQLPIKFSSEALTAMSKYTWPGNIRELENICERLIVLAPADMNILPEHLPEQLLSKEGEKLKVSLSYDPSLTLNDIQKVYVLQSLQHFKGNKTKVAKALGVTIKTLYNKLHEYGIFDKFSTYKKTN